MISARFCNCNRASIHVLPHPEHWEIGYIAEEAKSLGLDHLIFYDEDHHPDGINYRKLCLYLVEIVREHERRLNPDSPHLEKYMENE